MIQNGGDMSKGRAGACPFFVVYAIMYAKVVRGLKMYWLLPVFLLFAAYMMGSLIKKLLHDSEQRFSEAVLVGTLLMFLLWEFLVLPAIKIVASFSVVSRIYSGLLLAIFILSFVFCNKEIRKQWKTASFRVSGPALAWGVLFLIQIGCFLMLAPDVSGDFTVETVNTTIQSDLIYENHPGMGDTFVYGITFRGKLVSLPLFYAYLKELFCVGELFPCHASVLVYRMIPIWGLLLSYMVYGLWADVFLGKTDMSRNKRALFFIGLGFINIFGVYSEDSIFYYQMYRGFRGETLVFAVLIPYTIYLCWQIYSNKKYASVIYLLMAGITTLVLTDYQKGFMPFVMVFFICSLIAAGYRVRRWLHCRN
ncbi:MAG: hypothetical protein K2J95_10195 [Lachnospiraceae bacterium]|nr:hypothetical protein [Lachnospiraceae bacterium]MDE6744234.1 hypothetical protein [Lachnospiraceae bacterium]